MVSSASIQSCYIDLYKTLRNYTWDDKSVQDIVDLELDSFQAIPNIHDVYADINRLSKDCTEVIGEDEDMKKAFDNFYDILSDNSDVYCILTDSMKEVV